MLTERQIHMMREGNPPDVSARKFFQSLLWHIANDLKLTRNETCPALTKCFQLLFAKPEKHIVKHDEKTYPMLERYASIS